MLPKNMSWTRKHSSSYKPQFRCTLSSVISDIVELNLTTNKTHLENLEKYCPFWSLCHLIVSKVMDKDDCKKSTDDILEMIERFHRGREAFILGGQEMKITKQGIQKTFGISGGEDKITISGNERNEIKHTSELYMRRFNGLKNINQTNIKAVLKAVTKGTSKENTDDVPRIMTLYLLASLLIPNNGRYLGWGYLNYVENLEKMKKYDWSGHIFEKLHKSLCTNDAPERVSGCIIALPYLVMEKFNITKPANPGAALLCHKWNLKKMTELTKNANYTVDELCRTKNRIKGWPTSKKRSSQAVKRNFSSQILKCDGKRAVSQDPEKTESCKKMRNSVAGSFHSFIAWSPQAMESPKQVYLARESNSDSTDKTSTVPNSNGCLRQKDSGRENDPTVAEKSPFGLNLDSSTKTSELEIQRSTGHPEGQLKHVPLSIPGINVVVNNSNSSTRRIELGKQPMLEKPNDELEHDCPVEMLDLNNSMLMDHSHSPSNLNEPDEVDLKSSQILSGLKNFKIIINGIDITHNILERTRTLYYNLCHTRGSLLHKGLTKNINLKYVVFIITETTHISTAIKNSKISTPQDDFVYWIKALESFSAMGMDVWFMRARLNRLLDFIFEEKKATEEATKAAEEAKAKEKGFKEKRRALELEIEKIREKKRKFDDEREGITKKADEKRKKSEGVFKEEANAPW